MSNVFLILNGVESIIPTASLKRSSLFKDYLGYINCVNNYDNSNNQNKILFPEQYSGAYNHYVNYCRMNICHVDANELVTCLELCHYIDDSLYFTFLMYNLMLLPTAEMQKLVCKLHDNLQIEIYSRLPFDLRSDRYKSLPLVLPASTSTSHDGDHISQIDFDFNTYKCVPYIALDQEEIKINTLVFTTDFKHKCKSITTNVSNVYHILNMSSYSKFDMLKHLYPWIKTITTSLNKLSSSLMQDSLKHINDLSITFSSDGNKFHVTSDKYTSTSKLVSSSDNNKYTNAKKQGRRHKQRQRQDKGLWSVNIDGDCDREAVDIRLINICDNDDKIYEVYKKYNDSNSVMLIHPEHTNDRVHDNILKIVYASLEIRECGTTNVSDIIDGNIALEIRHILLTSAGLCDFKSRLAPYLISTPLKDSSVLKVKPRSRFSMPSNLCTEIMLP